jgi:hypothetical protein
MPTISPHPSCRPDAWAAAEVVLPDGDLSGSQIVQSLCHQLSSGVTSRALWDTQVSLNTFAWWSDDDGRCRAFLAAGWVRWTAGPAWVRHDRSLIGFVPWRRPGGANAQPGMASRSRTASDIATPMDEPGWRR